MTTVAVLPLDSANYDAHHLHHEGCAWMEKNCYVDAWIEVLHALHLEPAAMLGFTVGLEFEGDQWTFFKPPHDQLSRLYGIEVFELNVWRGDILTHALHHVREGKLVLTEADAYWLPDTQGTTYRSHHNKSTIVINALDMKNRRLGYFHNGGYHSLQGENFSHLFRADAPDDPAFLPLFAEYARLDRVEWLPACELAKISLDLLRRHLARLPKVNPVKRFIAQFPYDLEWLKVEGRSLYHGYAFATLRQLGAAFELAATHLEWLAANGEGGLEPAQAAFTEISSWAKALVLKAARAVNTKKVMDFAPMLEGMAVAWDAGMDSLKSRYQ